MEFGIHFFPSVGPAQKSGEQYFEECLALVDRCDELDYRHVRIVEHYFHRYGGYSPNPLIFLAAVTIFLSSRVIRVSDAQRVEKSHRVPGK